MIRQALALAVAVSMSLATVAVASAQTAGGPAAGPATRTPFEPAAMVNDDVITRFDLDQRVRLRSLATGAQPDQQMVRSALENLVTDRLKLQAAKAAGIVASPDAIDAGVESFARDRGITPDQLAAALAARGASLDAVRTFVAAEIAWRNFIARRYGARSRPSEADIQRELALAQTGSTAEFRLAEIVVPFTRAPEEAARARIEQARDALQRGASFADVAGRLSGSPSRENGGVIGWVAGAALPEAVVSVLADTPVGAITAPIRGNNSFVIFQVLDRRDAGATGAADRIMTIAQIVVPVSPTADARAAADARARVVEARKGLQTCDDVVAAASDYGIGSGLQPPRPLSDLPPALAATLAPLVAGDVSAPVRTDDGFVVAAVCAVAGGPSGSQLEAVRRRLVDSNLQRFADGYLKELERDALIEYR